MEQKTELMRNQILQMRKDELVRNQRELDMKWMNNRMEDGRMTRLLAVVQEEADMEKEYQERTDHAAFVDAKARKEIDLGFEIAKVQREETRAYQRRHLLRENEETLKTLSRKLQAGYVCRDLQLQIQNNKYRKLQEKEEDRRAVETVAINTQSDQEANEKRDRDFKYGQELRQQLVARQYQKQCQYEDTLIEKKMMDEIMRTIADEDQRELQMKRDLTEKSRKEMETWRAAKQAWHEKHKTMVIKEEKEVERQQQALNARTSSIEADRKRREAEKDRICQVICDKIMADEDKRLRKAEALRLLQELEFNEKNLSDDAALRNKLERNKQDTKASLLKQMEYRKQQRVEEKEREKRYLCEIMEKQKQEEEKEREKEAMKRAKNRKHCEAVLKQAELDRRARQQARQDEEDKARAVKDYQQAWLKEAGEERKEIIKQHVPRLLGFLQAGVVQKEDMPYVKEGAKAVPELADVNLDALTATSRRKTFPRCNEQCQRIRDY